MPNELSLFVLQGADRHRRRISFVKLEVRLFGGLVCENKGLPCFGQKEFLLEAPEGTTVQGLRELLQLRPGPVVAAVNGVIEKKERVLSDHDRIGLFPPVAGG